ncbi:thiamine-phosphate kinase [Cerasibacillus terrae]|uniref:Thiamine-monophosphate kinase n=1 Tax=Cerasibacillus terrae TaxID=2498845 RepID=A0A5C8NX93_9BACI|nr:thiamine-phosphate kinase [Cerasibacillus terrae]TXL65611.1 thiamine-phosphate kinase [Cerasibacillus terrae]
MDEFSFIDAIKPSYYKQSTLIKGIGDDAAVIRSSANDLVTAVDIFVEGVHFKRETMNAFHIGYRALAANLSDLAAMGADPAFYLVGIVIPKSWSDSELKEIFQGMKELADFYQMDLIGGDTVSGKQLTISITVFGYCQKEKVRFRHTAVQGDVVFVTGTLGDSCAGLHVLSEPGEYKNQSYFIKRHRMPSPCLSFVKELQQIPRVTLNDISDGIANEAIEIAQASDVSIHLEEQKIPVSKEFSQFPKELQHKWKYFGGEDFEILGSVAKEEWPLVKMAADRTNTQVTEVGFVTSTEMDAGNVYVHKQGRKVKLDKNGYTHLK